MIAGRYALVREIGRGGMGAVWLARDEVLGRTVAVKRIGASAEGPQPDLARAEREARLAASLNHPHVVAVFDLIHDGELRWLVMEYVDGDSLATVVREGGPIAPARAARLMAQAAQALAAAHAAGIVHRDVKPSNIMVTPADRVKLTDFGIARASADAALTRTGLVTGSPAYLAPEVATGRAATDRSDVWSLGATLYHALAGRPPYDVGDNVMGALYRIVHEDPPRLPDAGWLGGVLEATMATDPSHRWSMAQVARALEGGPAATSGTEDSDRTRTMIALGPDAPTAPGTGAAADGAPRSAREPAAPAPVADSGAVGNAGESGAPGRGRGGGRATGSGSAPRRRVAVLLVVLLALAAVAVALLVAGLGGTDDTGGGSAASSAPASGSASGSPSASATTSPSADAEARATAMEDFVRSYLANVTADPETTWTELTPAFQRASGGFERYSGFWATIDSAEVLNITADPKAGTVNYSVRYTRQNGSTFTDVVTLELVERGDSFKISGEQ